MSDKIKICHLTSVHPRDDVRIFVKECSLFVGSEYSIWLIVSDGMKNEIKSGVRIIDASVVKEKNSRFERMIRQVNRIYDRSLAIDADIYQLHDPELLRVALKLKRKEKKVIYDVHEDVPRQILGKTYLHKWARPIVSAVFERYENHVVSKLNGIVAATPKIRNRFDAIAMKSVNINNFPILGELDNCVPWHERSNQVAYIGGIALNRGIREMVRAFDKLDIPLILAGRFSDLSVREEMQQYPGWAQVRELGHIGREAAQSMLASVKAGMVLLHPLQNYVDSQPTKMFEYMAAGVPVIASDFAPWRRIIKKYRCGVCVDPFDGGAIAAAINRILYIDGVGAEMSENGRRAIREDFNWETEQRKLSRFYKELLS